MSRLFTSLGVVFVWLFIASCGQGYIVLEINSDLQIPQQVDTLEVVTASAKDASLVMGNASMVLKSGAKFPLEILLEPSEDTPSELIEKVTAFLNGTVVGRNEVRHTWSPHRVTRAKFELLPVSPN